MFLQKNGSLKKTGHQGFLALLVVDLASYIFVTVRENAFGEDKVLEFCGGTYSEVCQGKLRVAVASEKPVYMWYLNLVVKRIRLN